MNIEDVPGREPSSFRFDELSSGECFILDGKHYCAIESSGLSFCFEDNATASIPLAAMVDKYAAKVTFA